MKVVLEISVNLLVVITIVLWFIGPKLSGQDKATKQVDNSGSNSTSERPIFRGGVHVVLVPAVVLNRKGEEIGTLKRDDFQLYDKGKLQQLTGFSIQKKVENSSHRPLSAAHPVDEVADGRETMTHRRFIVFLFDDLHLSAGDLSPIRKAAVVAVNKSLEVSDVAAVISTSTRINTGFTENRATLETAINNLKPPPEFYQSRQSCPKIDHYLAYLINDLSDQGALAAVAADAGRCISPNDPAGVDRYIAEQMARSAAASEMISGERHTFDALNIIQQILSQMSSLPGNRTLVLISSGFITMSHQAQTWQAQVIDRAALANVTINALDARGLYTDMTDSSIRIEGQSEKRMLNFSSEVYASVLKDLASATGGTLIHDSNDYEGGLKILMKQPEFLYLLEFTPREDSEDGSFHKIKIKVNEKGAKIRARSGYLAVKATH